LAGARRNKKSARYFTGASYDFLVEERPFETAARDQPWLPPAPVPEPMSQLQKLHFACATFFITTPVVQGSIRQMVNSLT
jgi:hypothetical protein